MPSGRPFWAGGGGQGHARGPGQGPDRIEAWVAGRAEAFGRLAGGARGQQQIDIGEDVVEVTAECFGGLDRLDIGGERQFAARGQHRVAQDLADLLVVLVVFVGVVARRLEIEDAAVVFEDVGEFRREAYVGNPRAGRRQFRGGAFDQRLRRARRRAPRRGCGTGRCAAPTRCGRCRGAVRRVSRRAAAACRRGRGRECRACRGCGIAA